MNDFRRSLSRRAQQKAIDGIINAPSRPTQFDDRGGRSFGTSAGDRIRARHVDNFQRKEGFHANSRSSQPAPNAAPMPAPGRSHDASLLQSTLSAKQKETGRRSRKSKARRSKRSWRYWLLRGGVTV